MKSALAPSNLVRLFIFILLIVGSSIYLATVTGVLAPTYKEVSVHAKNGDDPQFAGTFNDAKYYKDIHGWIVIKTSDREHHLNPTYYRVDSVKR